MVAAWTRRSFESVGLTQSPPGAHLPAVQDHFVGKALLCLDVSYSMEGTPLAAAQRGAAQFVAEAREAGYRVGVVLWAAGVVEAVGADEPPGRAEAVVRNARPAAGTNLTATLELAIRALGHRPADRVVCVFGDGDVGDPATCAQLARQARTMGIRFVVRGLGQGASGSLRSVLTPDEAQAEQTILDVAALDKGIASMSSALFR